MLSTYRKATAGALGVVLLLAVTLLGCTSAGPNPALTEATVADPEIRVSGSGTAIPMVKKLAEAYAARHPGARFDFRGGINSGGAITGVAAGTLDLAAVNRPVTGTEAGQPLLYAPFARDAIVFAAREPLPVRNLTTAEVRSIYGGEVTRWDEVAGPRTFIVPLDRDEDESARKLVFLPLMGGQPVKARTTVLQSARDMLTALEATPGALGYTSLGLLRIERPNGVTAIPLDGIAPTAGDVKTGRYPWTLTFGLVRSQHSEPHVARFMEFAAGPEGSRLLEEYDVTPASF